MKVAKRKSKSHLIVSSVQEGFTPDIVKVFAQVAKHFKSTIYHIGPTVTEQEKRQYEKLKAKLSAVEDSFNDPESYSKQIVNKAEKLNDELLGIASAEEKRIKGLLKIFKNMIFVTNPNVSAEIQNMKVSGLSLHNGLYKLGKFLTLSPMLPSSIKNVSSPINKNALNFMREGKSWIIPHPVPVVESFPRPGLNEAHNCFCVGSMLEHRQPTMTRQQYIASHMPAAVFVVTDDENDEFHSVHLHIDYVKGQPVVLYDGLMFTKDETIEVPASDRASLWTDAHAPHQHPGVVGSLICLNNLYKPRTFIDNGDSADFESISPHTRDVPGQRENLRLINDLNFLRKSLTAVAGMDFIKNRIMIDSNHHEWVTRFVDANPSLIGMLDWHTLADKHFKDWKIIIRQSGENYIYQFGDFVIRHGDKESGVRHGESIFPSGKYMCGHFHSYKAYKRSVQVGCAAKLGPKYVGGQINAWQNQIATFTKSNGIAAIAPKSILHDKTRQVSRFVFRNEIFEVPQISII